MTGQVFTQILQKAAKAAEEAHAIHDGDGYLYEHIARAVIASIEPDDAMVEAGANAAYSAWVENTGDLEPTWEDNPQWKYTGDTRDLIRAALKAGLRAILDEGEKG
jgi:hypothetical protein